ncbi:MAG: hypothetical protein R3E32_06605 [Chitinophagales bacterium]
MNTLFFYIFIDSVVQSLGNDTTINLKRLEAEDYESLVNYYHRIRHQ